MGINFNSLPTDKPSQSQIIPKGTYKAKVEKAEMKQGKDPAKPPYLNIQMDVSDTTSGTPMGKLFMILTESEAPLPRYQLGRFIKALKLPITGDFELKDLTKMVVNKELIVDIMPEDKKDGSAPQRSIVDVFSGEIFYPIEQNTSDDWEFPEPTTPAPTVTPQASMY